MATKSNTVTVLLATNANNNGPVKAWTTLIAQSKNITHSIMTLATIIATTMAPTAVYKVITLSATILIAISVTTTLNAVWKPLITVITVDAILAKILITKHVLCRNITPTAMMITIAIGAMIKLIALSF